MPLEPVDYRADLVRRLRCVEGHVHGIAATLALRASACVVERGEDCESIVRQTLAVQAALREVKRLILKRHLAVCLREHWQTAEAAGREPGLAEVVALYQLIANR